MKMTPTLINKFLNGDSLTDSECKKLHKFFTQLEQSLQLMGCNYALAHWAILRNKTRIENFLTNRNIKF